MSKQKLQQETESPGASVWMSKEELRVEPWRTTQLKGGNVGKGVHQNHCDGIERGGSKTGGVLARRGSRLSNGAGGQVR